VSDKEKAFELATFLAKSLYPFDYGPSYNEQLLIDKWWNKETARQVKELRDEITDLLLSPKYYRILMEYNK
jgi:hypothetical protein